MSGDIGTFSHECEKLGDLPLCCLDLKYYLGNEGRAMIGEDACLAYSPLGREKLLFMMGSQVR